MKKFLMVAVIFALAILMVAPMAVQAGEEDACYGLVAAAYGQAGIQGEHASSFAGEPHIGIANLATVLYEAEIIEEDSLTALGQWLNAVLELDIEVCGV